MRGPALLLALPCALGLNVPSPHSLDLTDRTAVVRALNRPLERRQAVEQISQADARSQGNTPQDRGKWLPGFDINTDYDFKAPSTGVVVEYDLRITRTPCNPDGASEKQCTLINGQYPGPTIRANWGDTLKITVHNDVPDNGTSMHWHGVRQLHSNPHDGVNGITECPIAPHTSRVYTFLASQHGSSWYHSHHSAQYGEGVVGTIVFDGPTTANYDVDLGPLTLTDWFYESSWVLDWRAVHVPGPPPGSQNVLVNGTMKSASGTGEYNVINVEQGKSYKLRLTNTAVDHDFVVTLDNHPFTVVAVDFVPVVPRTNVRQVTIGIGQRMDIIFTASNPVGNYWLRVLPGCGTPPGALSGRAAIYDASPPVIVGSIIRYHGAGTGAGNSTSYTVTNNCDEEPSTPYWPRTIPKRMFNRRLEDFNITFGGTTNDDGESVVAWFVNNSSLVVDWGNPTLQYVLNHDAKTLPSNYNVREIKGQDTTWHFAIIQTIGLALPHPIHLHGHDFWVLGLGTGVFNENAKDTLKFDNPERRDTAILPPGGYLVIGWLSDNPGAWLLHCHIGFHISQGFGLQFLERKKDTRQLDGPFDEFHDGCKSWNDYYDGPGRVWAENDSGL